MDTRSVVETNVRKTKEFHSLILLRRLLIVESGDEDSIPLAARTVETLAR